MDRKSNGTSKSMAAAGCRGQSPISGLHGQSGTRLPAGVGRGDGAGGRVAQPVTAYAATERDAGAGLSRWRASGLGDGSAEGGDCCVKAGSVCGGGLWAGWDYRDETGNARIVEFIIHRISHLSGRF